MAHESTTVERVLARIAGGAFGVVARAELLEAGVTVAEIVHRVRTGALIREYPGVYRVGHRAPSVGARYVAAVRACGEGAVLSGRAAAFLWGLVKGPAPPPEVTARRKRVVQGLRVRRCRLVAVDVTAWRGIPITSVARTLVDLAGVLGLEDLARACHEAGVRHRTTPAEVEAALARRPNVRGAGKLRRVLRGEQPVSLSRLERGFLEGDEFRRFTYADVFEDGRYMLSELRGLLHHGNSRS